MQLLPLLICPQERYLLFKIPQDYKHASSCQFAVHTPRILCWNKQKVLVVTLFSVGDIRWQSQTSPQQFTASTSQFASTKMSQPSVQHFKAPNLQSTLQSSLRPVSRRKQVLQFRTNQHDVWTQNCKHSLISIHRKLSDLKRYHSR